MVSTTLLQLGAAGAVPALAARQQATSSTANLAIDEEALDYASGQQQLGSYMFDMCPD
jgi:hypothetical protein